MLKILITVSILIFLFSGISMSQDLELNADNFQKEVLESDKIIIIDFWAKWCRPCKTLHLTIERLIEFNQQYHKDKISWFKVNVDKNRKFLNNFRPLRGLPTIVFYKDGKEVDRIIGLLPFLKIQERINNIFKAEMAKKDKKDKKKDGCDDGVCPPPEGM